MSKVAIAREGQSLLAAPCLWCGYNGAGYYQAATHSSKCPWYLVGGEAERREMLSEVIRRMAAPGGVGESVPPGEGEGGKPVIQGTLTDGSDDYCDAP